MAVLVLRGANTECQPFFSGGQQLEPSTEYLFGIFARWVEDYVGGLNSSCLLRQMSHLDPRTPDVVIGRT